MSQCPYCKRTDQQIKAGRTQAGSQRFHCKVCQRTYTPEPKAMGYDEALRQQAVRLVADGVNFRRTARLLGVNHQTVINWVNAAIAQLPPAPLPETAEVIEMDEMYTFVKRKKRSLRDDAG
jgi:transposase-like protein